MNTIPNDTTQDELPEVVAETATHESTQLEASEDSSHDEQDLVISQKAMFLSSWEQMAEWIETLEGVFHKELSTVHVELSMLQSNTSILNDVHESNKKLSEEFHEREVLAPVFHMLIGLADRCYRQIAQSKQKLKAIPNAIGLDDTRSLIESREADLIEIESRLADFGVQRYLSTATTFNAKIHKCVQRVPTLDTSLVGIVASRFLPGYKRFGAITRPECVSVYAMSTKQQLEEMPCLPSA